MKRISLILQLFSFLTLAAMSISAQGSEREKSSFSAKGFEVISSKFLLDKDNQPMPVLEISVLTKEKASKKKMRKYARKADRFYMTDNVKVVIIYFFNDRQSHQEFLRNGNSFHGLYVRGRESKKDSFDYFRLGYVKLPVGTPIPIRPF